MKAREMQAKYDAAHPARQKERHGFRIGIAAAAAVLFCGTVTAGAVSDWDYAALFRKYFSEKTGTEIDYDFSGMGIDIGESYRGEGYTLTVEAVLADQTAVYILYDIALDESVQAQIRRITYFENIMQQAESGAPELLRQLSDYYTSPAWKEDFDRDERGEFPPDLKRGVLSEDGIYAMLEDNRDWHEILNPDID